MTLVKFNNKTRNAAPYFNTVFDSLFAEALNKNYAIQQMPSVNIYEDDNDYKIELAAPGLTKEDFKLELKKDNLAIWAEKKETSPEAPKNYSRKEFQYQSFARSFVLPEGIDTENISATYTNGILCVSLGKKAEAKSVQKEIIVS